MHKIVLPLAAAGALLVAASPAAAQYYPAPPPPAPGYGYGYGYGQGNWGDARSLHDRIDNIERQVNWLARSNRINGWRADRLLGEARRLEQRLRYAARDGLNPYEARDIRFGIDRLEQQVRSSTGYDRDERWDRDDHEHDRY